MNKYQNKVKVVGILNITPDSFSDGGKYLEKTSAINHAKYLIESGVSVIDIGAESTRPLQNKPPITIEEECQRFIHLLPDIIDLAQKNNVEISIDSRNPATISRILNNNLKINWINDVSGADNIEMLKLSKKFALKIVIMHNLGIPSDINIVIKDYENPVKIVKSWLSEKIKLCQSFGISKDQIIIDPGIGFGKKAEHSMAIIKNIKEFESLGCKILVGHSRKRFLNLLPDYTRDEATKIISLFLYENNVDYIRLHDVKSNLDFLRKASNG